jgi:hypothetical protein
LSLEEINGKFGDAVIVHFTDATEKQMRDIETSNEEKYSTTMHEERITSTPSQV